MSTNKTSRFGWLLVVIKILTKVGPKLIPLLGKLFQVAKGSKVALAAVTFGAWSIFFDWRFVCILMGSIFLHELGHIRAMKAYGLRTKGIHFIPFLGAAAVSKDDFPTRKAEAVIALWGPLWGFILALAALALYTITGIPLIAGIAAWIGLINLFNLLPINPLDGGRVTKSILFSFSSRITLPFLFVAAIGGLFLLWKLNFGIAILIFYFGLMELWREVGNVRADKDRKNIIASLAEAFGVEPQADAVIDAIKSILAPVDDYEVEFERYIQRKRRQGVMGFLAQTLGEVEVVQGDGFVIPNHVDGLVTIPRPTPPPIPQSLVDEILNDEGQKELYDDTHHPISPTAYRHLVERAVEKIARRSVTTYKRLITRKEYAVTGSADTSMFRLYGHHLFDYLTSSSMKPVMSGWQAALIFVAYIALAVALLTVMVVAAVDASSLAALSVFQV